MEQISIGDELKDGFERTNKWVGVNLSFISEIESFYKQRALIEREYAEKLSKLCNESFKKIANLSSNLSVGENPIITPGSLESASIIAWKEILIQTENISKEKKKFSKNLDAQIGNQLNRVQSKYLTIKDKWEKFDEELTKIRDKNYDSMMAKKKSYDHACESMESQRAKKSANNDKFLKRQSEMYVAKNSYLLSISVCNRLKDKYYYQDVPEILDGLQQLNEVKTSKINSIWLKSLELENESNLRISEFNKSIDNVVKQNLPKLDTAMFVKHNLSNWNEPLDFRFLPSNIWHDDDQMIIEDHQALDDLKLKLNKSCLNYENYLRICNDEKQEVEELVMKKNKLISDSFDEVKIKSFDDYEAFESLLTNSIYKLQKFTNDDTKKVIYEVEIETIQNSTNGIDMTYTLPAQKQKKSRFNIFKKDNKQQDDDNEDEENFDYDELSGDFSNFKIESNNRKSRMFGSLANTIHNVVDAYNAPVGKFATNALIATALYAYQIQGDDELNMRPGEQFNIVEEDDGSGWTVVSNSNKEEGLVPTSYLKIENGSVKKQGPKVQPRKSGKAIKRMEILYDYEAQGDDELDVAAGDTVVIIQEDDGSGWTEAEINGQMGLIPTSYGKIV